MLFRLTFRHCVPCLVTIFFCHVVSTLSLFVHSTPLLPPSGQDRDGNPRVTGEEWLVKKVGAYLPGAYEEVVELVDAYVLTEKVSHPISPTFPTYIYTYNSAALFPLSVHVSQGVLFLPFPKHMMLIVHIFMFIVWWCDGVCCCRLHCT